MDGIIKGFVTAVSGMAKNGPCRVWCGSCEVSTTIAGFNLRDGGAGGAIKARIRGAAFVSGFVPAYFGAPVDFETNCYVEIIGTGVGHVNLSLG